MKNKIILFVGICISSFLAYTTTIKQSITFDENTHIVAGYEQLRYNKYELNTSKPPLIQNFIAIPLLFMDIKMPTEAEIKKIGGKNRGYYCLWFLTEYNKNNFFRILKYVHFIMLFWWITLIIFMYKWAEELYGKEYAIIPSLFICLSPLLIAYAPLATMDIPEATATFIFFYTLFKLFKEQKLKYLIYSVFTFALALSTKLTTIIITPILFLTILIYLFFASKLQNSIVILIKKNIIWVFLICISLLHLFRYEGILKIHNIVNIGTISFFILSLLLFRKDLNQRLNVINYAISFIFIFYTIFLGGIILTSLTRTDYQNTIFAGDFFKCFNALSENLNNANIGRKSVFMNGIYSEKGFYTYYLYHYLVKLTIPELLTIFFSLLLLFTFQIKEFEKIYILIIGMLSLLLISLLNKEQIGIRHSIFAYPFFILSITNLFIFLKNKFNKLCYKFIYYILLLWLLIINILIYPNYIGYTNGLLFSPQDAYKYIAESNINWGQDFIKLKNFLIEKNYNKVYTMTFFKGYLKAYGYNKSIEIEEKDEEKIIKNLKGILIVEIWRYHKSPNALLWLKQNKKPKYFIGTSFLIYEL